MCYTDNVLMLENVRFLFSSGSSFIVVISTVSNRDASSNTCKLLIRSHKSTFGLSSTTTAGRSSFPSSFMACQQFVTFILLYFVFVLTCPASVMFMCCVYLCSGFCQAGPSYLTPPLPVYIAITCWRTLNQTNKQVIIIGKKSELLQLGGAWCNN